MCCNIGQYEKGCICKSCWETHDHGAKAGGINKWRLEAMSGSCLGLGRYMKMTMAALGFTSHGVVGTYGKFRIQPDPGWDFPDLARHIEGDVAAQIAHRNHKLPPQICLKCNFKNDYAGPEHLQPNGSYICRSCR